MAMTKAGAVADDPLRLLFKRTLKDLTPHQKRLLAGEIALVIPNEGMMQGRPDPVWLQSLHAFVRRELGLVGPSPAFAAPSTIDAKTVKVEEHSNRIRSGIEVVSEADRQALRVAQEATGRVSAQRELAGGDRFVGQEHAAALRAPTPSKPDSSGRKGGRPAISPTRARQRLLTATKRFRDGRDETEPLTNVGLATAAKRNEETISSWLKRAEWTLDELDVEWTRQRRKKPE